MKPINLVLIAGLFAMAFTLFHIFIGCFTILTESMIEMFGLWIIFYLFGRDWIGVKK